MNITQHLGASVTYKIQVLNPDGSVALSLPEKKNLILNSGLDLVATNTWINCIGVIAIGSGAKTTRRDSGAILLTRVGNVVTASSGFFIASDVGRRLKFGSGTGGAEANITVYTSPTQVTVSATGAEVAQIGTVWYTTDTGLTAQIERFATGRTGVFSTAGKAVVNTYTFTRAAAVSNITVTEIGWAPGAGGNLFGNDSVNGGVGVAVLIGQQLQVTVAISVAPSPTAAAVALTTPITGVAQNATMLVGRWDSVTANASNTSNQCFEPSDSTIGYIGVSDSTSALVVDNFIDVRGSVRSSKIALNSAYAAGSFTLTKSCTFSISEANHSIRTIAMMNGAANYQFAPVAVLLSAAFTKAGTNSLQCVFTLTWDRILSN